MDKSLFNLIQDYSASDGDTGGFYNNIGDFNGDGLIDFILPTENYHGDPINFRLL